MYRSTSFFNNGHCPWLWIRIELMTKISFCRNGVNLFFLRFLSTSFRFCSKHQMSITPMRIQLMVSTIWNFWIDLALLIILALGNAVFFQLHSYFFLLISKRTKLKGTHLKKLQNKKACPKPYIILVCSFNRFSVTVCGSILNWKFLINVFVTLVDFRLFQY